MLEGALHGQVALITGAGSGIGAAMARSLADRGAEIVLTGRREDRLREVAESLATASEVVGGDISVPGTPERLVGRTVERFGRLDVVVHAAGLFQKRPIEDTDDDFWHRILEVNLRSVVSLTRVAWEHLRESRGQVLLVSSAAALRGFADNTAYAASKGGMNAVGEVLREEGRAHGIRILTVCPAQTDTELWDGKAPELVRTRMMRPSGVGELLTDLVASDRSIDFGILSIQPPTDPWSEEDQAR